MPTWRRRLMTSVSGESTLWPSRSTSPVARVPGTRSCIRLKTRRKVVLPQPEGPISAVILRAWTASDASWSAWKSPYQKLTWRASSLISASASRAGGGATSVCIVAIVIILPLAGLALNPPDKDPGEDVGGGDESDEQQRGAPSLLLQVGVGDERIPEDGERQRAHRLQGVGLDDVVAERREKGGGGLSAGTCHRQQGSGDDAAQARRHNDLQGHPPAGRAESQARLAERIRDQHEGSLRGS